MLKLFFVGLMAILSSKLVAAKLDSMLPAGTYEEEKTKEPTPCARGMDFQKEYVHFLVTKNAEKYLDCSKDSDCFYFPFGGGFITNLRGIPYLSFCSGALTRKLFPVCVKQDQADFSLKPLEYQTFAKVPHQVECKQNSCKGIYYGKKRDWDREFSDGKIISLEKATTYDSTCAEFLIDPVKSYKSLKGNLKSVPKPPK